MLVNEGQPDVQIQPTRRLMLGGARLTWLRQADTMVNRVSTATLLAVLAISMSSPAAGQNHDGPAMPIVDVGACPFEGCHYGDWTTNGVVAVRRSRSVRSPVVVRLVKGEQVTALTGAVVIVRPGRVEFSEPTDLASTDGTISARPGDTLYLLSHIGEGFTNAWFKGRFFREVDGAMAFFNARCDTQPDLCTGRVIQPAQSEWWIQIRTRRGGVGWTNEPEKFDGKDHFGA